MPEQRPTPSVNCRQLQKFSGNTCEREFNGRERNCVFRGGIMRYLNALAVAAILMCCMVAGGKNKKKFLLPADVLKARTVLVLIDPNAGVPLDAPNANRKAQEDVENALMNWGRFSMAMNISN